MKAVKFEGDETYNGNQIWIVVGQVRAVIWDDVQAVSWVFIGGGDEDYINITAPIEDVMTRLGFNTGGE